jgi:hypothetical protein
MVKSSVQSNSFFLTMKRAIQKLKCPSVEEFKENYFLKNTPCLISDSIIHWKALENWKNLDYFSKLENKIIPVETSSYVNFEQKLIPFQKYLKNQKVGYLAQVK